MGRSQSTLKAPSATADLSKFPQYKHRARLRLYRAHHKDYNPWYFSASAGRFDLESPRGTLNLASSREVAMREMLGKVMVRSSRIPAAQISGKRVSTLEVPATTFADFTSTKASAFGIIPGDVSAPRRTYAMTQKWAKAIHAANFGGIRSRSRFSGGNAPCCLYLFGDAGQHELGDISAVTTVREVMSELRWITIDPTPASSSLIIDP
ncbi:hypothetical protein C5C13_15090 [Clavibacter michiganensis]|nr:hypothetical protein C5C13_15090 [Clavibacter michiganensis]